MLHFCCEWNVKRLHEILTLYFGNHHIIQINNEPIIKFQELYKLNILNINFCLHLELSMQWNPVSSDVMTSVSNPPIITSSVISHGSPTPQMEDGPPPSLQNNTDFMNGPVDKSFEVSPIYSFLLKWTPSIKSTITHHKKKRKKHYKKYAH